MIPDPAPEAELLPVVTVQQYRDLTEAQLAMGALESAGIPSYLRDENTVRTQWLWSNLIGGIRLQVREEDRAAAEALLLAEVDGGNEETLAQLAVVRAILARCGATEVRVAADEVERERLWKSRKGAFPALATMLPDYYAMDGTIPRRCLPDVLDRVYALAAEYGMVIANVRNWRDVSGGRRRSARQICGSQPIGSPRTARSQPPE